MGWTGKSVMTGAVALLLLPIIANGQEEGEKATVQIKAAAKMSPMKTAVQALIGAQYGAIEMPDIEAFASFLTEDVFWFGSAANEAISGRDAVIADLNQVFGPMMEAGASFETVSSGMKIGLSPDGGAAWIADQLELRITLGEDVTAIPYRITSVAVHDEDTWSIVAQHWSIGVPNEQAMAIALEGGWTPLAPIADAIGNGAEPVVALIKAGSEDASAWLATFSDHPDAFAFGSAPEEVLEGGPVVKKVFGDQVEQYKMRLALKDGVIARLAPSGTLAWAACNLDVTLEMGEDTVTQPYRALLVYLKQGDEWELVQSHFSNGQSS